MSTEFEDSIQSLIDSGKGDVGRLEHIIQAIKEGKKLYDSDKKYVESILDTQVSSTESENTNHDEKNLHDVSSYHPEDQDEMRATDSTRVIKFSISSTANTILIKGS